MLISLFFVAGCGANKAKTDTPLTGWHQQETWQRACYYPPEFEKLDAYQRKEAQGKARDSIISQWSGEREDGLKVEEGLVSDIETIFLTDPKKVEQVSKDNLNFCESAAASPSLTEWTAWVIDLPNSLTEGECFTHFENTVLDYVEIDTNWMPHDPLGICQGNTINVRGSENDKFRIEEDGPWINVDGDKNMPTMGGELPCKSEGCYAGMLVLKFIPLKRDGQEDIEGQEIYPIGVEKEFTAPADGVIYYGINDDTWFDNKWYESGGIQDHASITIKPAE